VAAARLQFVYLSLKWCILKRRNAVPESQKDNGTSFRFNLSLYKWNSRPTAGVGIFYQNSCCSHDRQFASKSSGKAVIQSNRTLFSSYTVNYKFLALVSVSKGKDLKQGRRSWEFRGLDP